MSRSADTVSIPFRIDCGSSEYHSLLSWSFPSVPFYERQVLRVLAVDVPQRFAAGNCQCWIYKDGADEVVGFGVIQFMSEDCLSFAEPGKLHTYLVVLGTHPGHQKRGHGKRIFNHLFDLRGCEGMGGTGVPPVHFLTGQRPVPPIFSQALIPTQSIFTSDRMTLGMVGSPVGFEATMPTLVPVAAWAN